MPSASDGLPVTGGVVAWARERAGFSSDEAAEYFPMIAKWESGEALPSYPQLEQMADKFKVPVAVFFFPEPPAIEQAKTSFRTLTSDDFSSISRPVQTLLRKGQAMQLNLAELNEGRNPARRRITQDLRFTLDSPLQEIALEVRKYVGVPLEKQQRWATVDEAVEQWRQAFVEVGVFVFKDAFHVDDYFGFCLYDDEFPIIYVNNSSPKSRQVFTLFHELGHLLFHTSGIDVSNDDRFHYRSKDARAVEIRCNAFAAEFLIPDRAFRAALKGLPANRETATSIAEQFKVSREVVYRRMLELGLVAQPEYEDAATTWAQQARGGGSGGNYYFTQFAYLGRPYIDLALGQYKRQRIDDIQLAEYLNIKPKSVPAFEEWYERTG